MGRDATRTPAHRLSPRRHRAGSPGPRPPPGGHTHLPVSGDQVLPAGHRGGATAKATMVWLSWFVPVVNPTVLGYVVPTVLKPVFDRSPVMVSTVPACRTVSPVAVFTRVVP